MLLYPNEQMNELIKSIELFKNKIDISNWNPSNLHYKIYAQYSSGQTHNHLYYKDDKVALKHSIDNSAEDIVDWTKLIDSTFDFKMYPNTCNDNNIEAAMRKALKSIKS